MPSMFRLRAVLTGWGGAPGLMTFYVMPVDAGTALDNAGASSVSAGVRTQLAGLANIMPTAWQAALDPVVDIMEPANGNLLDQQVVFPAPAIVTGIAPGGFGPQAAGLCINYKTGSFINGRRVRGRVFLVPVGAGADGDGTPSADWLAVARGVGTGLAAPAPGFTGIVWHRPKVDPITKLQTAPGSAHAIIAAVVSDRFAVLRSRRA